MYLPGVTAYGVGIMQYANQAALQAGVGMSAFVITTLNDADAATFRATIGAGVGYTQIALKTASFTAADAESYIVDSSAGPNTPVVVTAPACGIGKSFKVKWNVGTGALSVVRAGADTIDLAATFPTFPAVLCEFTFTGDQSGTNWIVS